MYFKIRISIKNRSNIYYINSLIVNFLFHIVLFCFVFIFSGNTIANGPSPWGDENWTKVANDKNKSTYDFSGIENSTKKTNTSDEIHNNNTKAVTKETGFNPPIHSLSSSSSVVQPSETRPFGLDHQQSLNIQEVSQETQKTPSDYQDPWSITPEQRRYYTKQFTLMQEDVEGKIDGIILLFIQLFMLNFSIHELSDFQLFTCLPVNAKMNKAFFF